MPVQNNFDFRRKLAEQQRMKCRKSLSLGLAVFAAVALGGGLGSFIWRAWNDSAGLAVQPNTLAMITAPTVQFELCDDVGSPNCIIDGDTIYFQGRKTRVADIDAPEKSDPKCPSEYTLALKATYKLRDLLNLGAFEVKPIGNRDQDQYGRDLRALIRDGRSLGDMLVQEGLARTWTGAREPWC